MSATLNSLAGFFQSGGIFMYPILAIFAVGVAITIERYLYLSHAKSKNRRMVAKLIQGMEHYKTSRRRGDFEAAMEESIMEAIPRLEKRTPYLAMFANIATLLGLLGTIVGLIKAFTAVAHADPSLKAEILATSISVAMNTTAFGLIVAIPLLFSYTVLRTKTTEIIDSFEMIVVKVAKHLSHVKNANQ